MYKPKYKPNQLICGTGQVAVITGWTVKQSIASKLEPEEYGVIGNLYSSTRGISPLIRNLLYNPHIRHLIVLIATKEDLNSGSCQCLLDFFEHGFTRGYSEIGKECWVINSPIKGYIDIEIEQDALELLRTSVGYIKVSSITDCIIKVKSCHKVSDKCGAWASIAPRPSSPAGFSRHGHLKQERGEPLIFPLVENLPTILPGVRYGHRIEGSTIAETWVKILHRIKTTGVIRPTGYDGQWQELIDVMAIVTDEPKDFYFPEPNYLPIDREFLTEYISQILDDAPKREGVKYTYGQRLRSWFGQDQIEQVINKLIKEIDAASAVMSLWDVQDHIKGGSPCLNHIWVRVVENQLSLTATLRSNDMFAAWPPNAMGLRALQQHIRDEIATRSQYNLTLGPLITISQSAHIYDDTWENVDSIINTYYQKIVQKIDYNDPVGNFLIELESGAPLDGFSSQRHTHQDNKRIIVKQTTTGSGEIVANYEGTNPLKIIREIASANPAIGPQHIGYLGIELQKAYICLKNNSSYWQDG